MATVKKEIFLASRFKEFKEIRTKLAKKIEAYNFMEAKFIIGEVSGKN